MTAKWAEERARVAANSPCMGHYAEITIREKVCAICLERAVAAALEEAEARGMRGEYASLIDCLNTELRENYGDAYQADMDRDAKPSLRKLVDLVRERYTREAEARGREETRTDALLAVKDSIDRARQQGRDAGLEEAARFVLFMSDTAHDQATMLLSRAENRDAAKLLFGLQHELWTLEDSIRALKFGAAKEGK